MWLQPAMDEPGSVPTRETLAFLEPLLGSGTLSVLEVGCGEGQLAAALIERGHRVLALDAKTQAVERARARGVQARSGRWPEAAVEFEADSFDLVFFGRLLHHLQDLGAGLEAARAVLRPGGRIAIEDYAWERVDHASACWVRALLLDLRALGAEPQADWELDGDALEAWWRNTRAEGLHTSEQMAQALTVDFSLQSTSDAPYAYRWAARYLMGSAAGLAATEQALARERRAIAAGELRPIGWRAVAVRR